jgi:hypothetical protein
MSDLRTKVEDAAREFSSRIVGMLKGMTLHDLVGLAETTAAKVVKRARVKVIAAPAKAARRERATPRKKAAVQKVAAPRKLKISPARRAQLRIHGTYIGMMRGLPAAAKAKIKAIAKDKGMKAAVEAMKKLPGRK